MQTDSDRHQQQASAVPVFIFIWLLDLLFAGNFEFKLVRIRDAVCVADSIISIPDVVCAI